jgi:hypothetical protein
MVTANDDGQLVDETKMMRSRWNEEVEITMQGELHTYPLSLGGYFFQKRIDVPLFINY